jgi:thiol-disulfide isomerase/thioredoxin
MKKIIVGGIVLIALAIAYAVFSTVFVEKDSSTSSTTKAKKYTSDENILPQASDAGRYIDYKEGVLGTSGMKLLFFHAPWCPQCRELDASIKAGNIPAGITIVKVDYDSNQDLRKKYGVTMQTTLAYVDESGNLIKKFVAYDEPNLAFITKNLMQ